VTFVPTPEQRAAIEHPAAPLLIVAGAGTGKTSVMAERMLHMVSSGQSRPDELLGLTFTNKAAGNLKANVAERLGADTDVTVTTYHGFGAALVNDHLIELGLDPGTRVLNRAQAWQLLFGVFDDFRFEQRSTFKPSLVVDDALALASRCADHLVLIDEVVADCREIIASGRWEKMKSAAAMRLDLCQVVEAYETRKRQRCLIDFGDQVGLAVRLLRENPEIATTLREQFPVVLLDEYQDTNYAQRVLLQLVYGPGTAVTAVGDDMQSIYAFRGAHLGNIMGFTDHFPPVTRLPLEINRRSGAELVTLANRIQDQVSHALPKTLRELPGAPPTVIECFVAADDVAEATEIAREIESLGGPWDEHAVLCRKRRLIPAIVAALEARRLPVDVIGAGGLLHRPEIVDLVAWLELLAQPGATVALLRLLEGPRYRLGRRDLAALARQVRRVRADGGPRLDLVDTVADPAAVADLSPAARTRLDAFRRERDDLAAAARRLSVLDLAELIALRTGLWPAAGELGRENLLRFLDLAARFAPVDGDPGLTAFVEYLHLLDETEEELAEAHLSEQAAVRVMTIHQAKGLEFDHVWVPGLAGGHGRGASIFPDARGGENPLSRSSALPWWLRADDEGMPHWKTARTMTEIDDEVRRRYLDEEWRLFYVACTRARRRLVCSTAQWYPGPVEPQGPSKFYEFVAVQTDLVHERFHDEPTTVDPATAARERRRARADARPHVDAVLVDPAPALFDAGSLPPPASSSLRPVPTAVSVTSLVSYARCPLQFYWSDVRPLPRVSSAAARLGVEVHRWIEERSGRQLTLLDPGAAFTGDDAASVGVAAGLRQSFLDSVFASIDAEKVEAPFLLVVDGRIVRGRIDAVYRRDGKLELVDFKTGRRPAEGDPSASAQLDLYALAAVDTWGADPASLRTTYCYLRAEGPAELDSYDWTAAGVDVVRSRLADSLAAIAVATYPANPGPWCQRCDFLPYCRDGQAAVQSSGSTP
jgi:DNA helicase-2/ATP-dependent DNA helicase PcrA